MALGYSIKRSPCLHILSLNGDYTSLYYPDMEDPMEKTMENEMETGVTGFEVSQFRGTILEPL